MSKHKPKNGMLCSVLYAHGRPLASHSHMHAHHMHTYFVLYSKLTTV